MYNKWGKCISVEPVQTENPRDNTKSSGFWYKEILYKWDQDFCSFYREFYHVQGSVCTGSTAHVFNKNDPQNTVNNITL